MILYLILKFMISILIFFLSPLSDVVSLPLGLDTSLTTAYSLVHAGVTVFPFLAIALQFLFLGITIEGAYYLWRFISYVARFIRGA